MAVVPCSLQNFDDDDDDDDDKLCPAGGNLSAALQVITEFIKSLCTHALMLTETLNYDEED